MIEDDDYDEDEGDFDQQQQLMGGGGAAAAAQPRPQQRHMVGDMALMDDADQLANYPIPVGNDGSANQPLDEDDNYAAINQIIQEEQLDVDVDVANRKAALKGQMVYEEVDEEGEIENGGNDHPYDDADYNNEGDEEGYQNQQYEELDPQNEYEYQQMLQAQQQMMMQQQQQQWQKQQQQQQQQQANLTGFQNLQYIPQQQTNSNAINMVKPPLVSQQTNKFATFYNNGKPNQLSQEQQKMILRKAMLLDKSDKSKNVLELQMEIENLKLMRNKDDEDLRKLKVELLKLDQMTKRYKDMNGFIDFNSNPVQLPERFLQSLSRKGRGASKSKDQFGSPNQPTTPDSNSQPWEYGIDDGIINPAQLLEDMTFVKNQLQSEIIRKKSYKKQSNDYQKFDNFFKQRNLKKQLQTATAGEPNQVNLAIPAGGFPGQKDMPMSGQNQSQLRLQINALKTKCKFLKEQIDTKDGEITKYKAKGMKNQQGNPQSQEEKVKSELKRAHHILKQLRKRLNQSRQIQNYEDLNSEQKGQQNPYEKEYMEVMEQIQEVLGIQNKAEIAAVRAERSAELNKENTDKNKKQATLPGSLPPKNPARQAAQEIEADNQQSLEDLKQKIADLKSELDMSPRQFEDKLLNKLREEIISNKQKMQAQLKAEIDSENQRMGPQGHAGPAQKNKQMRVKSVGAGVQRQRKQ